MKLLCNYQKFPSSSSIKNNTETIEFSMSQLIHAAYTVGKHSFEEVHSHPYYSEREKDFRISLLQAFLKTEQDEVKRSPIFDKLDPSEKGAINYFLGMIFTNLIAHNKFLVKWLIHLDLFKGKVELGPAGKKPDFVGYSRMHSWMVFEAKGVQRKTNEVERTAIEQLKSLKRIDGNIPRLKVASILHAKIDEIFRLDLIDPSEKKDLEVKLKAFDYASHYYSSIYYIIKSSLKVIKINNRQFATRDMKCNNTIIGLDLFIYKKLEELEKNWLLQIEKNNSSKENTTLERIVDKKLWITPTIDEYLNQADNDNENKEYFIGNDGVYISYYGANF